MRALLAGDGRFVETHDSRWCAFDAPCLGRRIEETSFAVVDLETTGSVMGVDQIMQIGLVTIRGGRVIDRFSSLLSVERAIPPWVTRLTGLRKQDLAGQPTFGDVAPQLAEILDGCVFVAHDVRFDLPFLRWEYIRRGLNLPSMIALCTLKLSSLFWPDLPSHSLNNLAGHFDLAHDNPHRADEDAAATAGVLTEALSDARDHGIASLGDLLQLRADSLDSGDGDGEILAAEAAE